MKSVGVVVEYNPFHNGHAYHLARARKEADADIVIAVMSGPFLQRGEPALLPKWIRAKMALYAGVDIVVELPYAFATQKANTFADGAVSILAALGCDSLMFGSETGDIHHFHNTASFIEEHRREYEEKVKVYIQKGLSFPAATSSAYQDLQPSTCCVDLSKPNNILGFQYLRAVKEQHVHMRVMTIPRINSNYHDEHLSSESISSATSIRKALFSENGKIEEIQPYVPRTSYEVINEYLHEYKQLHHWELYWPYLRFRILQASSEELRNIYEVEEGLENRLSRLALEAFSFQDFMERLKTKRYTWTRLQRMCVHILTNTKKEEMETNMKKASYIRLLGMNEKGRAYLNQWKKHAPIPLISKISAFQKSEIALDIKASRLYALGAHPHVRQAMLDMEFNQPPIYLMEE